jgi:hypothetical protein
MITPEISMTSFFPVCATLIIFLGIIALLYFGKIRGWW